MCLLRIFGIFIMFARYVIFWTVTIMLIHIDITLFSGVLLKTFLPVISMISVGNP